MSRLPGTLKQKLQRQAGKWRQFVSVARRFGHYVRKLKGQLILAWICGFGYTLMGVLEPWPLKLIFDHVLLNRPVSATIRAVFPNAENLYFLYFLIGTIILIAIIKGIFYYYQQLLTSIVGNKIISSLRLDLYGHLQRLSFSFHDRRRTGDLITRLTSDIQVLREMLVSLPLTLTSEFFLILGMATVMFLMDWRLTIVALTILPALAILLRSFRRPMKEAMRKQREREGSLATMAAETLGAIKVVQGFRREQFEVDKFGSQNKKSLRSGLKAARLEAKLNWATELAVAIVTAIILGLGVHRTLQGRLSPGDLLVFAAYLRTFYRPLRRVSRMAERSARATAAGERILELLETNPTVRDLPGAVQAPRFRGQLLFDRLSFHYANQEAALKQISLEIQAGQRIAIVGPTGAGKTSLMSLIPRFYDPTEGCVCIDGRDIREFTLESLRRQISLVFQEPILFAATIAENIGYGRPEASPKEIMEAAALAGIDHIIRSLPHGYQTMLGERGGTLSGGQRQCVAIARAIVRDAPIVLLDEPTTGLDNHSSSLVIAALDRLMEGRTVIMITHQLRNIQQADRIIVLQEGQIVEDGSHADLIALHGIYAHLLTQGRELPV